MATVPSARSNAIVPLVDISDSPFELVTGFDQFTQSKNVSQYVMLMFLKRNLLLIVKFIL
jgi:hypothetical protein